jgi:cytochrome c-type biogenesis protein CcmF
LRGEHELDSFLSRESSFLFNNLILVGATFATFWGTVFPLISEAVRGVKITVGPPFFNQVNGPIFLGLIALMGICPLIGWRRASRDNLLRNFLYPLVAALVLTVGLFLVGVREGYALLAFGACAFVAATLVVEFYRGVRARRGAYGENPLQALPLLVWQNKPRYGGYIVHLGVILIAVGVAGMIPHKNFYTNFENPVSVVAIRTTPKEDLYVILAGWEGEVVSLKAYVNPLIVWLWVGGVVMLLGTTIAVWPERREERRPVRAQRPVVAGEGAALLPGVEVS